jgi:negative regulator of sigma E activity
VDDGERLAAYLAGELDADDARALEAALARDPALRARLESIRATDDLLASLPPVEPPAGFADRLRAAVATELDRQLGAEDRVAAGDALAARRAVARATPRPAPRRSWWPQLAAAAAVLAIGGIGLGVMSGGLGGADEDTAPAADGDAAGTAATEFGTATADRDGTGPVVVARGRTFDAASLPEVADDPALQAVLDQRLGRVEADAAAEEGARLFAGDDAEDPEDTGGAAESADEAPGPAAPAPQALRTTGPVAPEDLEAVRRCLPGLLDAQPAVIPVYAELATFEGQDAIVYGLVGNDPEEDTYRRVELWVVGRGDCQVIHLAQVDR